MLQETFITPRTARPMGQNPLPLTIRPSSSGIRSIAGRAKTESTAPRECYLFSKNVIPRTARPMDEQKLAWDRYLSALANLFEDSDTEIKNLAKRKKTKQWAVGRVLAEAAEATFETKMRCIQHKDLKVKNCEEDEDCNEAKLPTAKPDNLSEYNLSSGSDLFDIFKKYQANIPKCHQLIGGILDLTRESLYGCKEFSDSDIKELAQDFANSIAWDPKPVPDYLQDYFSNNCEKIQQDKGMKKLHYNIQFIKENMYSFRGSMTEEELKMISTFPLFRSIFQPNIIKDAWGEIQAFGTKNARNEKSDPFQRTRLGRKVDMKGTLARTPNKFEVLFGDVSGGLVPLGISSSSCKKRYLDKIKLAIIMRDFLNSVLKECQHVTNDQRKSLVVMGLDLNFYAMDWCGGLYRFGLLDHCISPSQEDSCDLFEDVYCILKELESVKQLYLKNMQGKRRRISIENSPVLNMNRTPPK
ncbi:2409_t:CDS:10 [Ambispora leptoticha]|uniref:2409_t:CDS:1 n=1 Tax=Ambispora leptoticha TaxID=144679 RepID=A0A9N9F4S8_9GLOM|nr:2409_t:CDS:10 [Ambispora leptoticha]